MIPSRAPTERGRQKRPYGIVGCSVPGCDRPHRAKGLCVTHWKREQTPDWRGERREKILGALRAFHHEQGRAPTNAELGMNGGGRGRTSAVPHHSTLVRYFGSVANALREAGMEPRRQRERIARRETIAKATKPQPRTVSPRRFLFAPDFLLALPEMRRELERQFGANTNPSVAPSERRSA